MPSYKDLPQEIKDVIESEVNQDLLGRVIPLAEEAFNSKTLHFIRVHEFRPRLVNGTLIKNKSVHVYEIL